MQPVNAPNHTMILLIIEADEEGGQLLVDTLKGLNQTQLLYGDQLVDAIYPIKDKLTIVDSVIIDVPNNETIGFFNKTF